MREILFRGKNYYSGEWYYGDLLHTRYKGEELPVTEIATTEIVARVRPETVGQYTGLTDKNGTKIFEGDIVRQDYSKAVNAIFDPVTLGFVDATYIEGHHIGVVKMTANGVGMINPTSYDDTDGTHHGTNRFVRIAGYRCKVVGNIFDNSELLKPESEDEK